MKLAFHIGARGTLFSKLICLKTGSKYSHVELVFNEFTAQNLAGGTSTLCFSSDEQDGGTRFKYIQLDPEDWDVVNLPSTRGESEEARAYCVTKAGLKYDWAAILGFELPWGEVHDDNDRMCSEIVTEVLEQPGVFGWKFGKPWKVSPGQLYTLVTKELA